MGTDYRIGKTMCWRCHKRTVVYTWVDHEMWQQTPPPAGKPNAVRWLYSATIDDHYWANSCEHCGAIQGDWFIYMEPDEVEWLPQRVVSLGG